MTDVADPHYRALAEAEPRFRPDIFPAQDVGVRRGVRKLFDLPTEPTVRETLALSAPWAPNRSYATALLWSSLRAPEAAR